MLRLMKQKVREEETTGSSSSVLPVPKPMEIDAPPTTATTAATAGCCPTTTDEVLLVSHVPVSIRSHSSTDASSSSLSSSSTSLSDHDQYLRPETTKAVVGGDSQVQVPASASTTKPDPIGRKRSISTTSIEESNKKARTTADSSVVKAATTSTESSVLSASPSDKLLLLATDQDMTALSPLHCFIRRQIEVFQATQEDIAAPCPGRRVKIQLQQVGLRCIHCKNLPPKARRKRNACFPSSVARVYNSVSDMKFDHFGACVSLPANLREEFEHLRQAETNNKTSSSASSTTSGTPKQSHASTAQYYQESARNDLGMEDGTAGIFLRGKKDPDGCVLPPESADVPADPPAPQSVASLPTKQATKAADRSESPSALVSLKLKIPMLAAASQVPQESLRSTATTTTTDDSTTPCLLLASEMDAQYLTPIHRFVRRHVEVFAATQADVDQPSPGRKKSVVLGQVGLRCTHCKHTPPKDRVKRAQCYPPSIGQIYHAISNMKFDHFMACKALPEDARLEFAQLKSSSNRRGSPTPATAGPAPTKKTASSKAISNCTGQYYQYSALQMNLVDTPEGIRFQPEVETTLTKSIVKPDNDAPVVVPVGFQALMVAAARVDSNSIAAVTAI